MSVAFSPDSQRIVTGGVDNTANLWEAASGREVLTLKGHSAAIHSVAFSPDGQRIVTGSWDHTAKLWEAANGRELLTLKGHHLGILSIAFSPDSQRIVTGSWDHTAKVWDAAGGRELFTLKGHSVRFGLWPFRQTAADCHWQLRSDGQVWDAASGRTAHAQGHSARIWSAFSPDAGLSLAVTIIRKVWDAADGQNCFRSTGTAV